MMNYVDQINYLLNRDSFLFKLTKDNSNLTQFG